MNASGLAMIFPAGEEVFEWQEVGNDFPRDDPTLGLYLGKEIVGEQGLRGDFLGDQGILATGRCPEPLGRLLGRSSV